LTYPTRHMIKLQLSLACSPREFGLRPIQSADQWRGSDMALGVRRISA
jgi:hypothetical protein